MPRQRKPYRTVNGVLLLDKPVGATSNEALQDVKRLYHAKKAGHTGSLDPLADGLLIICFGEATKIASYLLEADKYYRTVCKLGIETTTGDSEGEITRQQEVEHYSDQHIDRVLIRFRGLIEQIPPMHSALKYNGKRLYELARQGVEVTRQPRDVYIHKLACIDRNADTFKLDIDCSKGTYIRTLVQDIGRALGCGAHVTALRRLGVGPYCDPEMVALDTLKRLSVQGFEAMDELLQPIDSALSDWPALCLTSDMVHYARSGQPLLIPGAPVEGYVRLYDLHDSFMGIGMMLDDGRVAPKRLIL
jgi:tRNA pseudouridine55 synthase